MTDKMYSYHDRVLDSQSKYIIIKASRRTGKTTLTRKWALHRNDCKVLFITNISPYDERYYAQVFNNLQPNIITAAVRASHGCIIKTSNGCTIYVCCAQARAMNQIRGVIFNKVVIDEAGTIVDDLAISNIRYMHGPFAQFLIIGDHAGEASVLRAEEKLTRDNAYYEEYSWIDAVNDGFPKGEFLLHQENMTEEKFNREFGPWDVFAPAQQSNKRFKHLLIK